MAKTKHPNVLETKRERRGKGIRQTTYRLPEDKCPWCSRPMSAASVAEGRATAPSPGDFAVCIGCSSLNVYDGALRLRRATEQERREAIAEQPELAQLLDRMQWAVRTLDRRESEVTERTARSGATGGKSD